jgi:hypothetical protein
MKPAIGWRSVEVNPPAVPGTGATLASPGVAGFVFVPGDVLHFAFGSLARPIRNAGTGIATSFFTSNPIDRLRGSPGGALDCVPCFCNTNSESVCDVPARSTDCQVGTYSIPLLDGTNLCVQFGFGEQLPVNSSKSVSGVLAPSQLTVMVGDVV